MQTIQQVQSRDHTFYRSSVKISFLSKFFKWCNSQEKYRFGWLAAILAIHGCVLTPTTVLSIILGGNSMFLWAMTIGAMAMALISNLAAMPTKITIPIFFLSVGIDLAIISISLAKYFLH